MYLSAYLLSISLNSTKFFDNKNKIVINEENISRVIFNSNEFEGILKRYIKEYINTNNIDITKDIEFQNGDMMLALHGAKIRIKGNKNVIGRWNLHIEIQDRYDFTDFKQLEDYIGATENVPKSVFSSTLNNFALVSSQYGVIKPYDFIIEMDVDNYAIE